MTKFYATHDSDDGKISEDATIAVFGSREEAVQYLLSAFGDECDKDSAAIEAGEFQDCWIKSFDAPKVGETLYSPFSYTQLSVLKPGQHPGGSYYWITPSPEVLVVADIQDLED